jgi:hypothetical protein
LGWVFEGIEHVFLGRSLPGLLFFLQKGYFLVEFEYLPVFVLYMGLQFLNLLIEVLDGLVAQLHLHCLLLQIVYQLLVFIETVLLLVPDVFVLLLRRRSPLILFHPLVLLEYLLSIGVVGREVPPSSLIRLLLQVAKSDSRFFIIHQRNTIYKQLE